MNNNPLKFRYTGSHGQSAAGTTCEKILDLIDLPTLYFDEADPEIVDVAFILYKDGKIELPKDGRRLELTEQAKRFMRENRSKCRPVTRPKKGGKIEAWQIP